MAAKVLLVEDISAVAEAITRGIGLLTRADMFDVIVAYTLKDALQKMVAQAFDLVLLDLTLPDAKGLEALHAVRLASQKTPVIVVSGDPNVERECIRDGAIGFMLKGNFSMEHAVDMIVRTVIQKRLDAAHYDAISESLRDIDAAVSRIEAETVKRESSTVAGGKS